MRINPIKQKLKAGQPVFGAFCMPNSPMIVEVCGHAGLDFLIIDLEHTAMSPADLEHLVRAAESTPMTAFVRCAQNEAQVIVRHLDTGAMGIHMPLVNSGQMALEFVRSSKYEPEGHRGLAPVRAAQYAYTMTLEEYTAMANREILLIAQVETKEGVDHLDEILAVEGLDVIFVGPTDISNSLGYPGQRHAPEVLKVMNYVFDATLEAGKVAGTIAETGEAGRRLADRGVLYLPSSLTPMIGNAVKQFMQQARG